MPTKPSCRNPNIARWALAAAIAAAASLLATCGGSRSDAAPGGGDGTAGAVITGRLWHDFFPIGEDPGFHVSPLDATRTRRVDALEDAVPTPDGAHYVTMEHDLRNDTSLVAIKSSRDGYVVDQARFNGYVSKVRPSPVRLGEMLLVWAGSAISGDGVVTAVDLPARRTLQRWPTRAAADWLPDGRVVSADEAGSVHVATAGGREATLGTLSVPGWKLRGLWAAPKGDRMITRWVRYGTDGEPKESDLWISNADATGLARLTRAGVSSYAIWSPDGQSFAFDWDPGNLCTGHGCIDARGSCELHVAPVRARGVDLDHPAIRAIRVHDDEGRPATLGCDLLGWTP